AINTIASSYIYTLSLHDALPISPAGSRAGRTAGAPVPAPEINARAGSLEPGDPSTDPRPRPQEPLLAVRGLHQRLGSALVLRDVDRKSTRLNSSHVKISYAVFCL